MAEGTNFIFYKTSEEAWQAMLLAIAEARTSIDLEQYILGYDSIGMTFMDALKEASRRGVKVRVFCDAVGSYTLWRSKAETDLKDAGIDVKFFNPIPPWHPSNESIWYFRDHRKLMVVDSKTGFTGGACLSDEMRGWRDSYVKIEGEVVREMLQSFEIMWQKAFHKLRFYLPRRRKDLGTADFRYLTNAPLPGKRRMYRELVRALKSARRYIYLTTPYLLPDSRVLRNLKSAVRRGVEVKILVPLKTDIKIVDIGMATFFRDMMQHRIRIFRYSKTIIHGKTGVIDGSWSTIGSLNLDNLSLRYNFEGNIVSTDPLFASELESQFHDDLAISKELTLEEWYKRPLLQKFLEILVWPIRKFL